MSKEILQAVEVISNEKDIPKDEVFTALEVALATATARKKFSDDVEVQVDIDRNTGDYKTFQAWKVLDGDAEGVYMEYPDKELWLIDAKEIEPDIKPDEYIRKEIDSVDGRIVAQVVMQVMKHKLRESERAKVVAEYEDKVGQLVNGVVKRTERNRLIIDVGNNTDAVVNKEHMIPRDPLRPGDRVRGYLMEINPESKGPLLILSRTSKEFIKQLFTLEVPEIGDGLIDIIEAAREPGVRAKLAVVANDPRLDPVGACVGIRGARVQAVSNELAGERVDIIIWDENPAQYVINALTPAEVASIVVDEDEHSMDIAIPEDQLSKAIGRNGQNVRLASELTGWTLNVMSIDDFNTKTNSELEGTVKTFMQQLDVDEEVAGILAQEGYSNIEEVAYIDAAEMARIEEFDEDMVTEIQNRAQDFILTKAIAAEESMEEHEPTAELLNMQGMNERVAYLLAGKGITTMEDLADQSVDEVLEIPEINLAEDKIAALIMQAREPWFATSEEDK